MSGSLENPDLVESMTRVTYNRYTIRVWCQEDRVKTIYPGTVGAIDEALERIMPSSFDADPVEAIVDQLKKVSGINALEITDADGMGVVIYPEWP